MLHKDIPAKDIFFSESVKELNQRLEHMKQKRGMMLITGEPGVGKTVILRGFTEKLNPNLYQCCYIPLSTVNVIEFYRQISVTLGGEACWQKAQLFASIQTGNGALSPASSKTGRSSQPHLY